MSEHTRVSGFDASAPDLLRQRDLLLEACKAALPFFEQARKVTGFFSARDSTGACGSCPEGVHQAYQNLEDKLREAIAAIENKESEG